MSHPTPPAPPQVVHTACRLIPTMAAMFALLACLGGCRAASGARGDVATLGRLTAADRVLVSSGKVRVGLDREAVAAAWGSPTSVEAASPTAGPWEAWTYSQSFRGEDIGYFGVRRGWVYSAQARRYVYSLDDYYEAPVRLRGFPSPTTDVPYHRAWFDHGALVHFESTEQTEPPAVRPRSRQSRRH